MGKKKEFIVIGGGAGGATVVSQLLRAGIPGRDIALLEKLPYISYASCSMPYYIEGRLEWKDLFTGVEMRFLDAGVALLINTEVKEVDFLKKQVRFFSLEEKKEKYLTYKHLIIASGASPQVPFPVATDCLNVFTLKNPSDAKKIKNYLLENHPKTVAVIGAGLIGLEMLYVFEKFSPQKIYLLDNRGLIGGSDGEVLQPVSKILESKKDVVLALNTTIRNIDIAGGKTTVFTDKGEVATDIVLVATGVKPELGFLSSINRLEVEGDFSTSQPDVWAVGDCTRVPSWFKRLGKVYFPSGALANRGGRICAQNLLGKKQFFKGTLQPLAIWTPQFEYGTTGLKDKDFNPVLHRKFFHLSSGRAGKLGENFPVFTKIITDNRGKILGASMLGKENIAKRIDLFSTFIVQELTLEEAYHIELTYQPMISPVWDPVLQAIFSALRRF